MRGLRRFCVGMTVALFASWSAPQTWAQPPQASPGGTGALNWPPAGMDASHVFHGQPSHQGSWPAPLMQGQGYPHPQAGGMPVHPAQYQPQGGYPPPPPAPPQGHPGMGGPYFGPGNELNPHPGLDMYRYGYQQTINENGLWFSQKLNASRKYHFGVEMMMPIYDGPGNSLFGYPGLNTGIAATDGVPPIYFSAPRELGTFTTTQSGGSGGGSGGGSNNASIVDKNNLTRYFPTRNFADMFSQDTSVGLKLSAGFENEDGTGISVNAWHGGKANDTFQMGGEPTRSYIPGPDPFPRPGNDPLYLLQLSALNGSLPINSGGGVAERIPFDTMFQMSFSQEAWGAGLHLLRSPIAQSDWYRVQPIIGLRYFDLREGFAFRGLDSGAEYEIVNFSDAEYVREFETLYNIDLTYTSSAGSSSTVNPEPGFDGRPTPDSFNDDALIFNGTDVYPLTLFPTNPYETRINASNHIRAAGPEFGFRTELGGGDNLKVTFLTTAGITATSESLRLSGFGVYNHFVSRVDPDNNDLTPDGGALGGGGGLTNDQTAFDTRMNLTHVSPTVDLSVNVEFRIFEYIPILRKSSLLEDAKLRSSYGFLYVGNLSRPQDSINYDSYPLNPSLQSRRGAWSMQQWTIGLDWQF